MPKFLSVIDNSNARHILGMQYIINTFVMIRPVDTGSFGPKTQEPESMEIDGQFEQVAWKWSQMIDKLACKGN